MRGKKIENPTKAQLRHRKKMLEDYNRNRTNPLFLKRRARWAREYRKNNMQNSFMTLARYAVRHLTENNLKILLEEIRQDELCGRCKHKRKFHRPSCIYASGRGIGDFSNDDRVSTISMCECKRFRKCQE